MTGDEVIGKAKAQGWRVHALKNGRVWLSRQNDDRRWWNISVTEREGYLFVVSVGPDGLHRALGSETEIEQAISR